VVAVCPLCVICNKQKIYCYCSFFVFQNLKTSPYASYAYDAVIVFALGLDNLLRDDPSSLESLHTDQTTS